VGEVAVVDLDGRIVLGKESNGLRDCVSGLLSDGKQKIVLNVAKVSFIDSAGVGALVSCFRSAQSRGAALKLCNPAQQIRSVLKITKLDTVLGLFDDESQAVQSFGG
jgi:anti-sigma B factor antagonist